MFRFSADASSASLSSSVPTSHRPDPRRVVLSAFWAAMLVLGGPVWCAPVTSITATGTADSVEKVYDKTGEWIEAGSGKIASTVVNTGGKVVGFVVFDALLRTPLYFVGLSSGPFDNRNNPSTVDQYILNPLEDGYREIISWFGDGTSFVAETGVWVAREGAKFVVKRGGNVVGEIGADVSKLGKDLGDALPSLNLGNDSSAAAAPALTTRTETVTRDAPLPIWPAKSVDQCMEEVRKQFRGVAVTDKDLRGLCHPAGI